MDDATDISAAFLRIATRLEDEANAPAVVPPCPAWCNLEPGHLDFDDTAKSEGRYYRLHEAYSGGSLAWVSAEECCDGQGGPVTLSAPTLRVDGSDYGGVEDRTPRELRALAAELLETAEVFERITGCGGDLDGHEPQNR